MQASMHKISVMLPLTRNVLFISIIASSIAMQHVRYVKPSNNSSSSSCPGQPCFTIDQYTEKAPEFFTSGSLFLFLAGNHTVLKGMYLSSINSLALTGEADTDVTVLFKNRAAISCEDIRSLTIEGLIFLCPESKQLSLLTIINSTDILINSSAFQGNNDFGNHGIMHIRQSAIKVVNCLFTRNSADNGGAIYALRSNITLTDSAFIGNRALSQGGAIFSNDSTILITGGALFFNNEAKKLGGAIYANASFIAIEKSTKNISRTEKPCTHAVGGNEEFFSGLSVAYFCNNRASLGGAIADNGVLEIIGYSLFSTNEAASHGGAIYHSQGKFKLGGSSIFVSNIAPGRGGAIVLYGGYSALSDSAKFTNNRSNRGGAMFMIISVVVLSGSIKFEDNSALDGGAIYCIASELITTNTLIFVSNIAEGRGGGLAVADTEPGSLLEISGNFINNTAKVCGGALYTGPRIHANFRNFTARQNSGSALCVLGESNILVFHGTTNISRNSGKFGGGIKVGTRKSMVLFFGSSLFDGNMAVDGGAIYSLFETKIVFSGDTTVFAKNIANSDGGALYAVGTEIVMKEKNQISFTHNWAKNGGAMYLSGAAILTFGSWVNVTTLHNHASKYGGAIFHEDAAISTQCNFDNSPDQTELPYCFINFTQSVYANYPYTVDTKAISYHDSAGEGGSFLYGGLFDRCRLNIEVLTDENLTDTVPYKLITSFFDVQETGTAMKAITSRPYQLCFCEKDYACSGTKNIQAYRGQKFTFSIQALDQLRAGIETEVFAKVSSTAKLELNQSSQTLSRECSYLSYNLYSIENSEELTLYPDGPCRDTGVARAVVNVTFLPCPDGFRKTNEKCVCEERLNMYDANCTIDEYSNIVKKGFWVSAVYVNREYQGLILYRTCPAGYCSTEAVNMSLDNPDIQCANNRSGMLCGACATNYSLMLGSSRCEECSNTYLALLLPFAAAGIALVVFLSVLRLTVATGMINGIILYANIVQVNNEVFFPSNGKNIVTIFLAWMNLDLGFETCFYNGMTAYSQTWLQFAFPFYIWTLICFMILISRYSITISKLVGHNPIAVLATLLFMSYTKILKAITEVYTSVDLEYPENETVTTWLKDANTPYLQSWHLFLTVVSSLVLVFLFLPYTLLLLLGYKLYRFSGRRHFRWFNRLRPLLDSYYAPYNIHTRYWTGLMLLVRCALYLVFLLGSLEGNNNSLLAINIAFTGIIILAWISGKIYRSSTAVVIEASVYLNLIILSTATLAGLNSAALVYSLTGIVFITMIGIIVYHFHITYTAKSEMWLKMKTKLSMMMINFKCTRNTPRLVYDTCSHDEHKIVTKTVIELREPLLDS